MCTGISWYRNFPPFAGGRMLNLHTIWHLTRGTWPPRRDLNPSSSCHSYSWPHIPTCLASPPGELRPGLCLHSLLISPAWSPLLGIRFDPHVPSSSSGYEAPAFGILLPSALCSVPSLAGDYPRPRRLLRYLPYSSLLSLSELHLHPGMKTSHSSLCASVLV